MVTKKDKRIKEIILFLFLAVIFIPVFVNADPIIPCGGCAQWDNPDKPTTCIKKQDECGYNDLLKLVNNIINWIIVVSIPVAAGVFAWAGFTYMTTGISDQKSYAKSMIWKVFIGLVFILAAWIIVGTIIKALLNPDITVPVQININKSLNFYA